MRLEPMADSELKEAVSKLYENEQQSVQIITLDGSTLVGSISGKTFGEDGWVPASEACFDDSNRLVLEHLETGNEHSIRIPSDEIAGIGPFPYRQMKKSGGIERSPFNYRDGSLYKDLFELTKEKAEQKGYDVRQYPNTSTYSFSTVDESFEWGEVAFEDDVLLYGDFEYFEAEGAITSLGFGAFGISVSGGRDRNIRTEIEEKISEKTTSIPNLTNASSATVSGYSSILVTSEEDYVERVEMEGRNWIPSIVTEDEITENESFTDSNWCLCYFCESSFMFPVNQWGKVNDQIQIFGDIIQSTRNTPWGSVDYFFKARAAGYSSDNGNWW